MRTRTRLGVSAVVLLFLFGLAAWVLGTIRRSTPAHGFAVTVLVNRASHVEVTQGTPLYFEVSLTSSGSSEATLIGSRWRAWHRLIRLESSRRAGMPWITSGAGWPRIMTVADHADGRPEIITTTEPSAIARLERGRQVYTVTEVVSPEEMARVQPGAYRIRAVLETPRWLLWGWRGRKVSQPVTVVVRDAAKAGDKRNALEKQRLARVGDFFISHERFAEAEQAARGLLALERDQASAHVLLGDALVGLKRREEALIEYRRAMALLPLSYEEPTLLMNRIRRTVDAARR